DGRNDSPGHSAQYLTYTMMEHNSGDILDQQIVDKREVDLKSPNMEKLGFIRCMESIECNGINIAEIVTDAHVQIAAHMRRQFNSADTCNKKIHQYDVWHGSKNLVKKLFEAAEKKENKPLLAWIQPLANHFWYSCQMAKGDLNRLETTLFSALHHVVGEHVWSTGNCGHVTYENGTEIIHGDDQPEDPEKP
ncbi:uncharacterized protein LOC117115683, partial [Anneissia japonica]|uniref:uncharacterized protein LOC117115683 n=1 Tax=Anneissia japonica TaxID=1529436 RepID=UPI001425978A